MPLFPTRQILKTYQAVTGRRILQRLDELEASQWFGREELLDLQRAKLLRLVEYAYRHVPYYRQTFSEMGFVPEDLRRDPAAFQALPVLTKETMRERSAEFFPDEPALRKTLRPHYTSGSTGEPFTFWEDHNQRDHLTAAIFRSLTVSGWRLGESHCYFWGNSLKKSSWQDKVRLRFMNLCCNRFVTPAVDLSPANLDLLVRRIRQSRPKVLTGYTGAMCVFAHYVKERQLSDICFQAVVATAEVLYPHQRKLLEEVFRCGVFDRYAATEIGVIGYECEEHCGLHLDVENCLVEVLQGDRPVAAGEPGELVATNLNNYGFPFLRYRLKDVVKTYGGSCACGRQSPMIECVQGRTVDIFRSMDGNPVWADLDPSMMQVKHIKQSQVVQKALDLVVVRLVRDKDFNDSDAEHIEDFLHRQLGQAVRIQFEFLDSIPQLESGKFRAAYTEVNAATLGSRDRLRDGD